MDRTEEMTRASGPAQTLAGSYIDWAAVFGGGVVAVGLGSVFTGFGAAVGLSTISAEPGEGSLNLMVILSAVWIVVSLVASYAAGGYIAGRMRRRVDKVGADEVTVRDGINGLVVWGLGVVASLFLLGAAVSTTVSAVGQAASVAGDVAGSVVGGVAEGAVSAAGEALPEEATTDPLDYIGNALLRPAQVDPAAVDAASAAAATASILGNAAVTGEVSEADRAYLISAVSATTGATQPEATARVDEAIVAVQNARAEAERLANEAAETAIAAAEAARVSAILTAFILAAAAMVAGAAAYVSAVRGGRHRDEGRVFGGFAYRG